MFNKHWLLGYLMSTITKNGDTTVKLSKKALNGLSGRAKPFESKKDCLERIILRNCSSNEMKGSDEEAELDPQTSHEVE